MKRKAFIRITTTILVMCLIILTLCLIAKPFDILNIVAILLNLFLLGSIIYEKLNR